MRRYLFQSITIQKIREQETQKKNKRSRRNHISSAFCAENFFLKHIFCKIKFRAKRNKIISDISIALKGGTFDLDNSMFHCMG